MASCAFLPAEIGRSRAESSPAGAERDVANYVFPESVEAAVLQICIFWEQN